MTGEDDVSNKRMHLHVGNMLTILVEILSGHSKVDHENVTGDPSFPLIIRSYILERTYLSAGLLNLLETFKFLSSSSILT